MTLSYVSAGHVAAGPATSVWANRLVDTVDYLAATDRWKITTINTAAANNFTTAVSKVVTWENETYDPYAVHSSSPVPAAVFVLNPGLYIVRLRLGFAANVTGVRQAWLSKGATGTVPSTSATPIFATKTEPAVSTGVTTVEITDEIQCAAGDVIWAVGFQNSGATIGPDTATYSSSFSGRWVAAS